jgi:hypothetical protein
MKINLMVLADGEPTLPSRATAISRHVDRAFDSSCDGANECLGDAAWSQRIGRKGRCTLKEKTVAVT